VTYNEPFEGSLVSVTKLDLFVDGVPKSIESCKGKGQHYDVIVVIWDKGGILNARIGYDLKEGKGQAERLAPGGHFIKSFVIRGDAAAIASNTCGWTVPSKKEISSFFGVSGKY